MNSHALRVLEFENILEILVSYAGTPLGRTAIPRLRPLERLDEIRSRLAEAGEMARFLDVARLPLGGFRDVASEVRRVAEGGRPAEPDLLYDVLQLLRGGVSLREALSREPGEFPSLFAMGSGLEDIPDLRERISAAVDPREGLADTASDKLAVCRRELRVLRESLRQRVQQKRAESRLQRAYQNEGVKLKNDRYLLAVKAEFRSWVPGVIRDRSQSGATLYVEPDELVVEGDLLLELIDDERNEVQRILWEFTREILAEEASLKALQEGVTLIDLAFAKASYARAFHLSIPEVLDRGAGDPLRLELRETRHPYLMWLKRDTRRELRDKQFDAVESTVVPLDIRLGDPHRLIIVTGPNTGGKTVVLKTVGLCVLLALTAIPIPAATGARIPHVSDLFADIGDEQSIEQNLSTFSSHLHQIVEILRHADGGSLLLLDELGAGTDPLEGAALATALLEHFKREGWHAIITTHLTSLKEYAFQNEDVENAAMDFDDSTLEPTFRLLTGLPGRSHALEIARRAGVPDRIIEEAEAEVHEVQAPTREIIEKMVQSHRVMEKERRRMERLRQRAQGERRAAEAEREEARIERDTLRREADSFIEEKVRDARERLLPLIRKIQNVPRSLQPAVDELRWAVELLLTATPLGERREAFARSLKKEDEVYLPKFQERCAVRKINKGERKITVLLRGIPTEVSFDDVSWLGHDSP